MNLSRPFILRPVATSLLMVALLLAGWVALRFLPLSALPDVDYPTIQVQTFYPGASPDVVTSAITGPLEKQLGQMPGLTQMTSTGSSGASMITLQFGLDVALDVAEQQVQAAINAASNLLPSDLPAPPIYAKINPADAPVLTLALMSTHLPLTTVQEIADTRLAQKISQLPGVGLVTLAGGQKPAIRVVARIGALAAYGLNIDDLRTIIGNANVNTPKGNFDGPARSSSINANDQLRDSDAYRQIIIAYKNGAPIRLGDVADIVQGPENTDIAAALNGKAAIIMNVQRQPGANVIAVVDTIKNLLPELQRSLPSSVDVQIVADRTTTIRAGIRDVAIELCLAVVLVIAVMFLFLRNLSSTLIPSLSVPLSLVGTFGVMYLAGFSLNNLTLMSLTIATGFVVDDAIVMIENIARYVEEGMPARKAALKGAAQIGFTILSLTVSLIAVLIPLLFMGDVVGRLFYAFAVTLAVTIIISAVVSLTLVPMMCARMLRPPAHGDQEGRIARWARMLFDDSAAVYGRMLSVVFRHKRMTLFVAALTIVATVVLYVAIPKGFFPQQDTGAIMGTTQADAGVPFDAMVRLHGDLARQLMADPAVENIASYVGVDGQNPTLNVGRLSIQLKDKAARDSVAIVMRRLLARAESVGGLRLYVQPVQDLTIDTLTGRTQYQFVLGAPHMETLQRFMPKLMSALATSPLITDLYHTADNKGPSLMIEVNRDAAARLGLTMASIDNALYDAFGQRIISTIFSQTSQYRVILQAGKDLAGWDTFYLSSSSGGAVPLSSVARITETQAPQVHYHLAQFPAVQVGFNLAPGASLGAAVQAIEAACARAGMPADITLHFQGAAEAFRSSLSGTLWLIIAAIVVMYIVLGVLYESFIHPLTILSTLPSAGIGALLALMLAGEDLGIVAVIGIILLIGIVKKNAIMMIDFALDAERREGKTPQEAIFQACLLRYRPIMMTTLAALLGALPLMLGTGVGAELRRPLGLAIVGGLLVSQVLTLFTTPVIYLAFDRLARRIAPGKGTAA